MKKLFCIMFSVLFVVLSIPFTANAENREGWIAVSDKYDLAAMADDPYGNYYLKNDIIFTENDFKYGSVFFNNGDYYCAMNVFYGTFDGCGHTISGIKGDSTIAKANSGTIKNLCISNGTFTSGAICQENGASIGVISNCILESSSAPYMVWRNCNLIEYCFSKNSNCGICDYNYRGTISHCINYSNINSSDRNYQVAIGSYFGGIVMTSGGGLIEYCINYGDINDSDFAGVGGICGMGNDGSGISAASIKYCINYGNINSSGYSSGIVGKYGAVENCLNKGDIMSTSSKYNNRVCGISDSGDCLCCVNIGSVYSGRGASIGGSNVRSCYYLEGSGGGSGNSIISSNIAKESSYPDLNFETDWEITDDGISLQFARDKTLGLMFYNYPNKMVYTEGEQFNSDGLMVMSYDNKGNWKLINNYTLSGFTGKKGVNTITVSANGVKTTFDVLVEQNINKSTIIVNSANCVYNGNEITPSVTVLSADGNLLSINKDYTLTYSNNINPGIARVSVKGIGNYTGEVIKSFVIYPPKATGVYVKSESVNSVSLCWGAQNNISGYSVEKYDPLTGSFSNYKDIATNSITVYDLAPATQYRFRVRAYKEVSSQKYYGAYSDEVSALTNSIGKTTGVYVVTKTTNSVLITWNTQGDVSGYSVEMYDSKLGSFNEFLDVDSNSATISYLTPNTNYRFRVRAYKVIGSQKYYGPYSNEVSVVTKSNNSSNTSQSQGYSPNASYSISSPALNLKKAKKSFVATWSKSYGATGYQIQYSLKKNFKGAKTKWSKGNKLTVKKLKSKKTYYVRVRAYKSINGRTYYSNWRTKKVKTK